MTFLDGSRSGGTRSEMVQLAYSTIHDAVVRLDCNILGSLLQRQTSFVHKQLFDRLVGTLACGKDPRSLAQEICDAVPELSVLNRANPIIIELLEAHQRGLILDSAIGIYPTSRYDLLSTEATVVARKDIKAGTTIHELPGFLIYIDPTSLNEFESRKKTNSVMEVQNVPHLLLGPISRVNHDCKANTIFVAGSRDHGLPRTIGLVTKRIILRGDEITVSYQNNYFGANNEDCLCSTCEVSGSNGWRSKAVWGSQTPANTVLGRQTRQSTSTNEKGMHVYSYKSLGDGSEERQLYDHQRLIPQSDVTSCDVCRVQIVYSYTPGLCALCNLRISAREDVEEVGGNELYQRHQDAQQVRNGISVRQQDIIEGVKPYGKNLLALTLGDDGTRKVKKIPDDHDVRQIHPNITPNGDAAFLRGYKGGKLNESLYEIAGIVDFKRGKTTWLFILIELKDGGLKKQLERERKRCGDKNKGLLQCTWTAFKEMAGSDQNARRIARTHPDGERLFKATIRPSKPRNTQLRELRAMLVMRDAEIIVLKTEKEKLVCKVKALEENKTSMKAEIKTLKILAKAERTHCAGDLSEHSTF